MRKPLKWTLITLASLLGVVVLIVVVLLATTFGGNGKVEDGRELEGFAKIIQDGYTSVAMLELGDGTVALVDAGNDPSGKAILAELNRRSLTPKAVAAVLLTHGHPDHVAAAALFPDAKILVAREEVDLVEGREQSKGPLPGLMAPKERPIRVARPVADADTFSLGNLTVTAFLVPGHTRGSTAWLIDGILFLGDSADATSDAHMTHAKWLFSDDTAQNTASLQRLAKRLEDAKAPVKWLVFAHSGILPGFEFGRAFPPPPTPN